MDTTWQLEGQSQDPGHLTLLVPDVTPIMDGDDGMPSCCPLPLSGTGPSCVVVGTGYITTMYTSTVHLYTSTAHLYTATVQSIYRTMCHPCMAMGHWVNIEDIYEYEWVKAVFYLTWMMETDSTFFNLLFQFDNRRVFHTRFFIFETFKVFYN